jgi:hypothetical protein
LAQSFESTHQSNIRTIQIASDGRYAIFDFLKSVMCKTANSTPCTVVHELFPRSQSQLDEEEVFSQRSAGNLFIQGMIERARGNLEQAARLLVLRHGATA